MVFHLLAVSVDHSLCIHPIFSKAYLFSNILHLSSHGSQHIIPLLTLNNIVHLPLCGNGTLPHRKQPFPINNRLKLLLVNANSIRIHPLRLQILHVIIQQFIQRLCLELPPRTTPRLAKVTPHNRHPLQLFFRNLLLHHLDIDTVHREQPVNGHWSILPDAMTPIHRLGVLMGVPIGVEDDARVGGGKVDSQSSRAGGEEEDEVAIVAVVAGASFSGGFLRVEDVHLALALVDFGGAVDAAVFPLTVQEIILNDIQQGGHLAEDEYLVFVPVKPVQHAIQQRKLATRPNQQLRMSTPHMRPRHRINRLPKHERMIAILAMIHLLVRLTQRPCTLNALLEEYIPQHPLIDHFGVSILQFGHAGVDDHFFFGGHVFEDVHFDAAE
mmetsp:Transcript_23997/g.42991  ORF Transcript_23997/g.42991 Transcript_23997/m.42991 type:complete len:383 (-) Transcript_23997:1041-2189(-)